MARVRTSALLVPIAALLFHPVAGAQDTGGVPPGLSDPLLAVQAVSGFEADLMGAIRQRLPAWAKPRVDEVGNLIVTIGEGKPHLLITTSVDEDGYLVSDITGDGYLRLHRVTTGAAFRLFDQFIYGQPVVIRTAGGKTVPGVVGSMSAHLQRGRDTLGAGARSLDDVWVDVGAESAEAVRSLGVQPLDTVTLRERGHRVAGGQLSGVSAHSRSCAVALLDVLPSSMPRINGTLTVAWTAQGLFGDRGALRLARELTPDRVVVLARALGGREPDARGALGRLGGGPVLAESSVTLAARAREAGIVIQTVPSLRAPAAWPSNIVETVTLPVLFMQTPVETLQGHDAAALTALLRALAGLPSRSEGNETGVGSSRDGALDGAVSRMAPLIEAYGVSGHETKVREAVEKQLPKWAKPQVDSKGNLTVSFGQGGEEILFVAHTDELGCEITDIREDGTAAVRRCGVYASSMEGHPVLVHTANAIVPAIFAPRPGYQRAAEWQPKAEDQTIYFGTDSRQATEALGVKKGDTVTVRKRFQPLAGRRATARSVDDRAGCAALLEALGKIDPAKVKTRVTFAWVVEEETGLVGAGVLAERLHPRYAFAVDTFVSSDTPIDPQRYARIPLGSGAVLRAIDNSSIAPAELVGKVRAIAAARKVPVTVGVTSGGNDASQFTKVGSQVMGLSWPGRDSHSAVEVIDGRDLDALVDLVVALVQDLR